MVVGKFIVLLDSKVSCSVLLCKIKAKNEIDKSRHYHEATVDFITKAAMNKFFFASHHEKCDNQ